MPAVALSRVGARVIESDPEGEDLPADAWQRLEALPDPRSTRGRIYPLACLVAITVCAFTAVGRRRPAGAVTAPGAPPAGKYAGRRLRAVTAAGPGAESV